MIISRVYPLTIRYKICMQSKIKFPKASVLLNRQPLGFFQSTKMAINELKDPKRHIDFDELNDKKHKGNVLIIDVREHSEIKETGKIPGSIHIPLGELTKALNEMSPEDFKKQYNANKPQKHDEIIFSCRSGKRSVQALKIGLELGYNKAGNYKGGWLDWAEKTGKC